MDYKLPKGYIDLIEKKYNLKVLDNHYILVDKNFQRYNMMIDVQFNDKMLKVFKEKYAQEKSKNHVAWEERKQTKSIRFYAEVGNNILLLCIIIAVALQFNLHSPISIVKSFIISISFQYIFTIIILYKFIISNSFANQVCHLTII